ncbi:MAG TPA: serine/threonine-protein kinase, partial [Ktedonobacteraceae bacterium]|nr:serine/threonine-protein kinase [Ktedonobacteraceae bacterium]
MALEGKAFRHYRILRLIGKGGMGEVYLLEDLRVQRQVAAKFIFMPEMSSDQEATSTALHRFWREATAIARLDHPSILPLYDHGEATIDGISLAYLIMPYRPDGSLVNWLRLRARESQTRQLTLKQIVHLIQQASRSLQYAHDHQVMHLDVKPANFLVQNGSPSAEYPDLLLSDFGISRLATMTTGASINVRGTPTYMAPEQCTGQPAFASDQYALAIMAYELLTGHPPFHGTPMSVMFAHVHEQPPSVSQQNLLVPGSVDLTLQSALSKKPEERFPSVTAFALAFEHSFQGIDRATHLRLLYPSPPTPLSQPPAQPTATGDIRATLAISPEEAHNGTIRQLTLANGQ